MPFSGAGDGYDGGVYEYDRRDKIYNQQSKYQNYKENIYKFID